jgi:hypothetical protein
MTIENIKQLMDNFDLASLLPDIISIVNGIITIARIALFAAPLLLLGLGMYYFLVSPKEANYTAGYRCYWGMGSEEAWRFTQKLAGVLWSLAGVTMLLGCVLLSNLFPTMEPTDVLWRIIFCLLFQGIIVLAIRVLIYIIVMFRFDRKGNRRLTWVQLWRGY